jgi:purine-binding chemotaxis protein CheW
MNNEHAQHKYIQVGIAAEKYAISIRKISEVIRMQEITDVPNTANYVKGVINLRGRIVPVVSLHGRLSMPEMPYSKSTRIVVVNYRDEVVGLIVDQVNKVMIFNDIQPPPDRIGSAQNKYVAGIGHGQEGFVNILDLEIVL